ncbi:hypothetical protein EAF04_006494 [Stromatinia cepivora]|nr:hypothetical protein EAF04_006494 [Stromatinia cepivora]
MPLERREENLLRWMEAQIANNKIPIYRECRGSWRPGFLVEDALDENGTTFGNYRITEINARFPFNAFIYGTVAYEGLQDMGVGMNGLKCAADLVKVKISAIILQGWLKRQANSLLTLSSYLMEPSAFSGQEFHCTFSRAKKQVWTSICFFTLFNSGLALYPD